MAQNEQRQEIVDWLAASNLAVPMRSRRVGKGSFFVGNGSRVCLEDGAEVDVVSWLISHGINRGVIGDYSVSYKSAGKYGERISFFKIATAKVPRFDLPPRTM